MEIEGRGQVDRSFLFVPANKPSLFDKALASGAHAVIIDLEDAVAEDQKVSAREKLVGLRISKDAYVRVNGAKSEHFARDVESCSSLEWVRGLVLPMVESGAEVERLRGLLHGEMDVFALVETAQGINSVEEIAGSGVDRLFFGSADYATQIGAPPSDDLYLYPRSKLALASAAAGLLPAVDGPTLEYHDQVALRVSLAAASSLGMGGKLCIHPAQVHDVNEFFQPSEEELRWATAVLAESENHHNNVFAFEGQMVDNPVLQSAHRIIDRNRTR